MSGWGAKSRSRGCAWTASGVLQAPDHSTISKGSQTGPERLNERLSSAFAGQGEEANRRRRRLLRARCPRPNQCHAAEKTDEFPPHHFDPRLTTRDAARIPAPITRRMALLRCNGSRQARSPQGHEQSRNERGVHMPGASVDPMKADSQAGSAGSVSPVPATDIVSGPAD
jgi:hypothetical protein